MSPSLPAAGLILLVNDKRWRDFLVNFLESQEYIPTVAGNPHEALQILKGEDQALVLVDCQTVSAYGPGLYAKMKVACPGLRIVFLCDKSHQDHRDLVKEAMGLGVYACLLAPFADWEVLAMVRHSQVARPSGRRPARPREK